MNGDFKDEIMEKFDRMVGGFKGKRHGFSRRTESMPIPRVTEREVSESSYSQEELLSRIENLDLKVKHRDATIANLRREIAIELMDIKMAGASESNRLEAHHRALERMKKDEDRIAALEQDVKAYKEMCESKDKEILSLNKQMLMNSNKYKSSVRALEDTVQEHQEKLRHAMGEIRQKAVYLTGKEALMEQMNMNLKRQEEKYAELEGKYKELMMTCSEHEASTNTLREELNEVTGMLIKTKEELQSTKDSLTVALFERDSGQTTLEKWKNEYSALTDRYKKLRNQYEEMSALKTEDRERRRSIAREKRRESRRMSKRAVPSLDSAAIPEGNENDEEGHDTDEDTAGEITPGETTDNTEAEQSGSQRHVRPSSASAAQRPIVYANETGRRPSSAKIPSSRATSLIAGDTDIINHTSPSQPNRRKSSRRSPRKISAIERSSTLPTPVADISSSGRSSISRASSMCSPQEEAVDSNTSSTRIYERVQRLRRDAVVESAIAFTPSGCVEKSIQTEDNSSVFDSLREKIENMERKDVKKDNFLGTLETEIINLKMEIENQEKVIMKQAERIVDLAMKTGEKNDDIFEEGSYGYKVLERVTNKVQHMKEKVQGKRKSSLDLVKDENALLHEQLDALKKEIYALRNSQAVAASTTLDTTSQPAVALNNIEGTDKPAELCSISGDMNGNCANSTSAGRSKGVDDDSMEQSLQRVRRPHDWSLSNASLTETTGTQCEVDVQSSGMQAVVECTDSTMQTKPIGPMYSACTSAGETFLGHIYREVLDLSKRHLEHCEPLLAEATIDSKEWTDVLLSITDPGVVSMMKNDDRELENTLRTLQRMIFSRERDLLAHIDYQRRCTVHAKNVVASMAQMRTDIVKEMKYRGGEWNGINSRTFIRCLELILRALDRSLSPPRNNPGDEREKIDEDEDDQTYPGVQCEIKKIDRLTKHFLSSSLTNHLANDDWLLSLQIDQSLSRVRFARCSDDVSLSAGSDDEAPRRLRWFDEEKLSAGAPRGFISKWKKYNPYPAGIHIQEAGDVIKYAGRRPGGVSSRKRQIQGRNNKTHLPVAQNPVVWADKRPMSFSHFNAIREEEPGTLPVTEAGGGEKSTTHTANIASDQGLLTYRRLEANIPVSKIPQPSPRRHHVERSGPAELDSLTREYVALSSSPIPEELARRDFEEYAAEQRHDDDEHDPDKTDGKAYIGLYGRRISAHLDELFPKAIGIESVSSTCRDHIDT
eukprot:CAMPEP_0185029246 /NCGR_PEP_ID=MMETSP1103-20130426/15419_1 /TAXON_ID=36769 /ORGANISM="Paraphysomonas bandaiensis, Strain Caron Lab Isolate" /LENGTH=1228 /DNA_ID=CAMNT_0027563913 /DNA_START=183 /DNA_END=3869 /DNA_ORIENTATION=+